jgi:hypothetical protein
VANQRYCTGVSNSHGGLTPAALVNVRLCIAKGVISPATGRRAVHQERGASAPRGTDPPLRIGNAHRRRYVAHATRSGGVSPPWSAVRVRARNAESHRMAVADAVRKNHRGLTSRRSRLCVRPSANIIRFPSATVRATHHGGLTPAALVNVRLCIAKGVISPATGRRAWRQERGASAPRGIHPPLRIGNTHRRRHVAHAIRRGWCKPGVGVVARQQCPVGCEQLTDARY